MNRTIFENLILKTALERIGTVLKYSSCPHVWDELHGLRALAVNAAFEGLVSPDLFREIGQMQDMINPIERKRRFEETANLILEVTNG